MAKANIKEIADTLWKKPSRENWLIFARALPKSGLKYYKVVYSNGGKLRKAQELVKSYAQLYDGRERPVIRIPIFEKDGSKILGATYYMKGLLTINKVDEWIKS
jgi:hypothetical protein